jgi:putative acetyltransferase
MINIRLERPEDVPQVRGIHERAFRQPTEADAVDRLRLTCPEALSVVAEDDGRIVGHILFTPVVIDSPKRKVEGMGLAPMAVLPKCQRQGIGSKLVEHCLKILRERGCPFVIVLGHPEYYPRFGFVPASTYKLTSQWENVPDESFMIIVFDEEILQGVSGVARYRDEFNAAM